MIGGPILYLFTEFRVVESGFTSDSYNVDRGVWVIGGALTVAILGMVIYYYSRKRA
jgi:hypothetical protein